MSLGMLKVKGDQIVDGAGEPIILRGTCLGGWMNMENFVTGFPGHESQHRFAMLKVLGQEKYDFFFDKWLEYFFTEADAKYFSSLGLNCIRIPFSYKHFEDDMNPRVMKTEGFKHLDRVIELCAKEGIYTILDLHALPGGHNQNWHSDNPTSYAAFWDFKDHQDRVVWLWEQIAAKYKDNAWVAGYNPINEPGDELQYRLINFYKRLEKGIRMVDPSHILFLDGNTYSMDFSHFTEVFPNTVYAMHDYSVMGFPLGKPYVGSEEQKLQLRTQYARKVDFHTRMKTPVWNGEFGPLYANPKYEPDHEAINAQRYALLGEQMKIYNDEAKVSWTIWLYKDVGLQGMVYASPDSPWMKLIGPFLEKKKELQLDMWGKYPSEEADAVMKPLAAWVEKVSPSMEKKYPAYWGTLRHLDRAVLHTLLADSLQIEFAESFRGKSMEELELLAKSFHFDQCVQRETLNNMMSEKART